ncbi:MAG: VanZ family protein [Chloroflexi bacterium]|nr:VanZ family protein [Chloroflexota bacterium]
MPIVTKLDRPWFWGLLSVVWMAVIYGLSDRPGSDYEGVGGFLSWLPFAGTIAHIGLYFVLSVFVFRTIVATKRLALGMSVYLTLFAALVYGALDELHQSNVAGRSSEVADVVADVFGAVLAVVFWFSLKRLWRTWSGKRSGS